LGYFSVNILFKGKNIHFRRKVPIKMRAPPAIQKPNWSANGSEMYLWSPRFKPNATNPSIEEYRPISRDKRRIKRSKLHAISAKNTKRTKNLKFLSPTQFPTKLQWLIPLLISLEFNLTGQILSRNCHTTCNERLWVVS